MNWHETTLSTQATLTRHEKEIILQGGHDIVWGIETPAEGEITVQGEYPNNTMRLYYADGAFGTVDFSREEATLPLGKTIVRIELGTKIFHLLEGSGFEIYPENWKVKSEALLLHDSDGDSFTTGWRQVETDLTWQAKIDLAKTILGNAVEDALVQRGVKVNEAAGEHVLDVITNPEVFTVACDYLALHLIYLDLLNGGWTELFERKYEIYGTRYKDELASALRRVNLDTDGDGQTDVYRASFVGYLSR